MQEAWLHHIWERQYFLKGNLMTSSGASVVIIHPGHHNTNAGPDFLGARLRIGDIEWAGDVELHIRALAWEQHGHRRDAAYNAVILHVVWCDDLAETTRCDGSVIPTLELKERISPDVLVRMQNLFYAARQLPCDGLSRDVGRDVKKAMVEAACEQRLRAKANVVLDRLVRNNNDWEETTYQLLAQNHGFKINADPFLELALRVPRRLLMRHSHDIVQIEAMLYGQAGLLEEVNEVDNDIYVRQLRREYAILAAKFNLRRLQMRRSQFRFLRLRPANFPTVRLAQFATLLFHHRALFDSLRSSAHLNDLLALFSFSPSPFWREHYHFTSTANNVSGKMGRSSIENVVINTVVPLMAAYGTSVKEARWYDKAHALLCQTKAEDNHIVRQFSNNGFSIRSGSDSQGVLGLYHYYCEQKQCLSCKVGMALMNPSTC